MFGRGVGWAAALFAAGIAVFFSGGTALAAGSATATLSVTATVLGSCTVTTTPVAFGVYDPSQAGDTKANGAITLQCASGTTPVVAMNLGNFSNSVTILKTGQGGPPPTAIAKTASGVTITRAMQNQGTFLGYDLFTDSSLATVWNSTNTVSPGQIGSVQPVTLTVYGDIPQKQTQTLSGGSFSDTVVVNVTF